MAEVECMHACIVLEWCVAALSVVLHKWSEMVCCCFDPMAQVDCAHGRKWSTASLAQVDCTSGRKWSALLVVAQVDCVYYIMIGVHSQSCCCQCALIGHLYTRVGQRQTRPINLSQSPIPFTLTQFMTRILAKVARSSFTSIGRRRW